MKFFLLIAFFVTVGCLKKSNTDGMEISLNEVAKPIKVVLRDSLYYKIVFNSSGYLSSLLPYRAGILEGHAYEFYSNGMMKKSMELKSGRLDGVAQYFYQSGNLWKIIHFKRDEGEFKKLVFWDSIVPVVRQTFEVDSTGAITKIKIFNKNGSFVKDSTTSRVENLYPE